MPSQKRPRSNGAKHTERSKNTKAAKHTERSKDTKAAKHTERSKDTKAAKHTVRSKHTKAVRVGSDFSGWCTEMQAVETVAASDANVEHVFVCEKSPSVRILGSPLNK